MSYIFAKNLITYKISSGSTVDPLVLEPNICSSPGGALFVSWTGGGDMEPDEKNRSYFSKSYDGGRTWQTPQTLFSHPRKGMFTPELFRAFGKIFAFPCSYYRSSGFAQDCHSYISTSENGVDFTPPSSIGNGINNIHVKDHLIVGDRIICACSYVECYGNDWADFTGANKDCIIAGKKIDPASFGTLHATEFCGALISDDKGKTWRLKGRIGEKGRILVEPTTALLSDGTIIMLIRDNHRPLVYESRSYDNGETWTDFAETGIPSSITKITLCKDEKGKIYLLHNPKGNRNPLSLWVSDDDMKSWKTKIDLVTGTQNERIAYPDAFVDESRGVLCFCWDDRKNIYYSEYPLG